MAKQKDEGTVVDLSTLPFRRSEPEPSIHIKNDAGAIHEVTIEHAARVLSRPGWREATDEEVEQFEEQYGIQVFDAPIGDVYEEPTREDLEAIAAKQREAIEARAKRKEK